MVVRLRNGILMAQMDIVIYITMRRELLCDCGFGTDYIIRLLLNRQMM